MNSRRHKTKFAPAAFACLLALGAAQSTAALDLRGTAWERAAGEAGVDPYTIYAVALVESPARRGPGRISPWPYAMHTPQGPQIYATRKAAAAALERLMRIYSPAELDVGLMQVNLRWHGTRVARPDDLLDPAINLRIGAQILAETLRSAPADRVLGLGRYHTWRDVPARKYGARVIRVEQRLTRKKRKSDADRR